MTFDDDQEDLRLTRLLRAVRAEADPALWTRVRAHIESRPRVPRLLLWAMRPAALATSVALFVACAALALLLAGGSTVATAEDERTLVEALIDERDAEAATPATTAQPEGGAANDSGSGR